MTAEPLLTDRGHPSQVGIRVAPGSPAAIRVERLLGAPLPVRPNTTGGGLLWLGPDEWLAVGHTAGEADIAEALSGEGAAVELSANRRLLELSGERARDVLASCCSLDLHPRIFPPGRCAQTLLAGVPVIIERTGDLSGYRLYVRPSLVAHVIAWIEDAIAGLTP